MNLHEYQAKQLFADYGIPVPLGRAAHTPEDAARIAKEIGGVFWVVKAQVHAGGRGKAGGVKLVKSVEMVRQTAEALLGTQLVTHQTGPEGLPVNTVMIEAGSDIDRELYLSVLVDRARESVVFMASAAGGMDIEEVAASQPEKIFTAAVNPAAGLQAFQGRHLGFRLGLTKDQIKQFSKIISTRAFTTQRMLPESPRRSAAYSGW